MKITFVLAVAFVLWGCGGSLSDEQRKKLHEGAEEQKIVRVTDAEIITASMDRGRKIYKDLESGGFTSRTIDSLEVQHHVRIKLITPGSSDALKVEKQLIEAYIVGAETGSVPDNIQKLNVQDNQERYDSLVYTKPKVSPRDDGSVKVEGIWNIYQAKRDVVLSLGAK
jgi:hypothetical protein